VETLLDPAQTFSENNMKWLAIALLMVLGTPDGSPLITDVTVQSDKIVVFIAYYGDPTNSDVTVSVTALDNTPPEWASSTVKHVWLIGTGPGNFNDYWPRMPAGHYRVRVVLRREQTPISAPPVEVTVGETGRDHNR
jgi:hypothetical protein